MNRLLDRLGLNQKLLLLVLVLASLGAAPLLMLLQRGWHALQYQRLAAAGAEPVQATLEVMHALQAHRELAVQAAVPAEVAKVQQQEVERALAGLGQALVPANQTELNERFLQLQQHWRALLRRQDETAEPVGQVFAAHSKLLQAIGELLDDSQLLTGLNRHPDQTTHFLHLSLTTKLLTLGETLAQLHAIAKARLPPQRKGIEALDGEFWRMQLSNVVRHVQSTDAALDLTLRALRQHAPSAANGLAPFVDQSRADWGAVVGFAVGQGSSSSAADDAVKQRTVLNKALNSQRQLASELARALEEALASAHAASERELAVMLAVLLLLGLFSGWWMMQITRSIMRGLGAALKLADAVSEGDLSFHSQQTHGNEFGKLLHSMQRMTRQLETLVSGVRTGAQGVATASVEIALGNMALSRRTEQQAASVEETSSAMEEITTTVLQNTANAKQANQLALDASQVAIQGGDLMREVVRTMRGISGSSRKIADIIGVIDGIAFQTNILALNAAVEAARAGEQGRGFAVVASEVRSLAQRSAAAAREIKELITSAAGEVEAGTRLVDEAGNTMDKVVLSVKRVNDIMASIAVASQEQAEGIEHVNASISQIDQAIQHNAALVEEAAAASEALEDQAAALVRSVQGFRLHGEASSFQADLSDTTPPAAVVALRPSTADPSHTPFVERRGPHRAQNVTRLPAHSPLPTAAPVSTVPPAATSAAGGGWESL